VGAGACFSAFFAAFSVRVRSFSAFFFLRRVVSIREWVNDVSSG